jgi:hypothetical protein
MLLLKCYCALHRHQGCIDIWHVCSSPCPFQSFSFTGLRIGYAPFAAGLYTNNRFGIEWLTLLGAALCGISAGVFWMAEAAIAISYPEPWNKGKALGYWLTYRLGGQILGGAINLGLNADRDEAGKVSYTVYLIFIALQACGPFGCIVSEPAVQGTEAGWKESQLDNCSESMVRNQGHVQALLQQEISLASLVHWSSCLCGSCLLHISCL